MFALSLSGLGLPGRGQRRGGQVLLRDPLRAGQVRHRLSGGGGGAIFYLSLWSSSHRAVAGKTIVGIGLEGRQVRLPYVCTLSWSRHRVERLSHEVTGLGGFCDHQILL